MCRCVVTAPRSPPQADPRAPLGPGAQSAQTRSDTENLETFSLIMILGRYKMHQLEDFVQTTEATKLS